MSKEEVQAKEAFDRHKKVRSINDNKNNSSLELGKLLYEMRESYGYETIAGEGSTFATYLADPDVNISTSVAYRYIGVYRHYIIDLGIKMEVLLGLDMYKLDKVKKEVTKENADEWLARVETLSRSDLARLVDFPDVDTMKCKHKYKPFKEKCPTCGDVRNIRN